jgi:transcription elongation GreA/GreB family factor
MIDKSSLRDAILAQLNADLDLQMRAALLARDEAISEESKAENKYDTHAQEAAYLAEGQARQATEIREAITLYQSISTTLITGPATIGACVRLTADGRTVNYFLGPRAGGLECDVEGEHVTVVTPSSPLGRQLLGARIGSMVTLPGRPKPVAHVISEIY